MKKRLTILTNATKAFYCLLAVTLLASCSNPIQHAIKLAGDNRAELQKVLDHYKNDPQKLKAAKFLIANMPGHYSYIPDSIAEFKQKYTAIQEDKKTISERKKVLLNEFSQHYNHLSDDIIEDAQLIKAQFLIDNIDRSFDIWENHPTAQHLTFDEFCELILPYKCAELQEFDNWKERLATTFEDRWRTVPIDDERHDNTYQAARWLSKWIYSERDARYVFNHNGRNLYNAVSLENLKQGECYDQSVSAIAFMRSNGIPACIETIPKWGRTPGQHGWYTILNSNGKYFPAPWNKHSIPGDVFLPDLPVPKIYRNTYAPDPFFRDYKAKSKLKLFSEFAKDVTDIYLETSDIKIPVKSWGVKENYAYLAVFEDYSQWHVVAPGKLRWGKARFDNVGRDILYIVLGYNREKLAPISKPFILDNFGEIKYLTADTQNTTTIRLTRKYPKSFQTATMEDFMIGGQIEAGNEADFSDADTLFAVKTLDLPDLIPLNTTKKYRYLRFIQTDTLKTCTLAELQFFTPNNTEQPLKGTCICPPEDAWHMGDVEKICDNDWLTSSYSIKPKNSWVGFDFADSVAVGSVRIIPRSDDNAVHPGDTYELNYWDKGSWKPLGEQVAYGNFVTYDGVPAGALLLLRNKTRGIEERPFTIEKGKIKWW